MANKTMSNPKSQEQLMKTAVQTQLARIKKEEEEELWISGEELYTEGSSDEEEYKTQSRSRRKVNSNHSSRTSSTNPTIERRGHSPVSNETKSKLDYSIDVHKDSINKNQFILKNISKSLSENKSGSPSMESPRTNCPSMSESFMSSIIHVSNFSTEEDQTENTEISWKAKRELLYNNEEMYENEWKDDVDISSIDTKDEYIEKEIQEVKSLDNLIRVMNDKVKKAIEETLSYQCENRKRLKKMLLLNSYETGKLAENTQQFFYLYPRYATLNTEFHNSNESCISLETNSKQRLFQNEHNIDAINLDNQDEWKFINSTDYDEYIYDATQDYYSNPYIVNTEIKEMLLEVKKEVLQKNLPNNQEQPLKENNCIFNRNNEISTYDTISTVQNLQNIDNDFINEIVKEIIDPLSIINVAENELNP